MNSNIKVEIVSGHWKSDETKTWEAVKVTVGDWSTIIFPKSQFETKYIKDYLENKKTILDDEDNE